MLGEYGHATRLNGTKTQLLYLGAHVPRGTRRGERYLRWLERKEKRENFSKSMVAAGGRKKAEVLGGHGLGKRT